jgi:PKD domain
MPRMSSLLRKVVLGVLVCAAVLAGSASAEFPGTEVTIVSPEGKQEFVLLNQIAVPENYGTYPIRNRNGSTTNEIVAKGDGVSVRQLLEEKNLDTTYGAVEIERPDGTTLVLDKDDVNSANYSPTFYVKNGQLWFLRPSTGVDDYNAGDNFIVPNQAAVRLTQTPAALEVTVEASRRKIEPGESVTFTATVEGGPANAEYSYTWDFDDGKRLPDGRRRVTHAFAEAGTFEVLVTAKIVGELRSDPGVVKIQVGDEQQSDKDREGGGDNGAAAAPDSGAVTGSDGAAPYTPSYTPPPVTSTPVPPTPPTPTPAPPKPAKPPAIATSGTTVEGNLLADVGDPPPSSILESAARAARDGNPKEDDGPDGAGVPEAALSIAGVLALLGLGAGIETRQGRLPRLRRPRLALPRRGA